MCGIFGFSILDKKTRYMASFLAFAMENRGSDSWGATNGHDVIKEVGPISSGFYIPEHWTQGIFHTRAATVGAISERNAHPFVAEHETSKIIGIHNGGIGNYKELNTHYKRECQVDSEHVFWHLVEGKPLEELHGRGALAWYLKDTENVEPLLHVTRWNFGDMEVAFLKDHGIVFCSNREPIERAARFAGIDKPEFFAPPVDCYKYTIERETLYKHDKMGFGMSYVHQDHAYVNYTRGVILNYEKNSKQCRRCLVYTKFGLCAACIRALRGEFEVLNKSRKPSTGKALVCV